MASSFHQLEKYACFWIGACCAWGAVPAAAAEPGVIFELNDRRPEPIQSVPPAAPPVPEEKTKEQGQGSSSPVAATPAQGAQSKKASAPPQAVKPVDATKPVVKPVDTAKNETKKARKPEAVPGSAQAVAQAALWETFWTQCAHKVSVCGGDFVLAPLWDPSFPSSLLALRDMRRYDIALALTDVPAARALAGLAQGDYGEVHSVEVVKILGPADMVVKAPWLYDLDRGLGAVQGSSSRLWELVQENQAALSKRRKLRPRLFHLSGFSTAAAHEGQRYVGPVGARMQVMVAFNERSPQETWQEITLLINLDHVLRRPLRDEEAKALLAKRGLTLGEFADWVEAAEKAHVKNPQAAQAFVLRQLMAKEAQVSSALPAGLE